MKKKESINCYHGTKELIEKTNPSDVELQDIMELKEMVKNSFDTASKKTHYHNLDEWSKPIWNHIHEMLHKHGFISGDPEANLKNLKASFWWGIYKIFSNIIYSPNLVTEVSLHHSSAWERNQAFHKELEILMEALFEKSEI